MPPVAGLQSYPNVDTRRLDALLDELAADLRVARPAGRAGDLFSFPVTPRQLREALDRVSPSWGDDALVYLP